MFEGDFSQKKSWGVSLTALIFYNPSQSPTNGVSPGMP